MMALPPPMSKLSRQLTGAFDHGEESVALPTTDADAGTSTTAIPPVSSDVPVVPAAAPAVAARHVLLAGGITDEGVKGKVNQDDFFVWQSADKCSYIMGVFDGHGRELGHYAARVARESFAEKLGNEAAIAALRDNPAAVLHDAFEAAHAAVIKEFRTFYESTGWIVGMPAGGYMTRHKAGSSPMSALCVHGGTTATVVVVLDARFIIIANVGDSTAILTGYDNPSSLRPITEWARTGSAVSAPSPLPTASPAMSAPDGGPPPPITAPLGAASSGPSPHVFKVPPPTSGLPVGVDERATSFGTSGLPDSQRFLELSADHSPECALEFYRMRDFRPCPHRLNQPELLFVYDTLSSSKLSCPPVFVVDSSGAATKTGRGSYYKNVRNEWATLVATPPYCQFQDALAFTRSLGDLHLQTYGVSHTPDIFFVDLDAAVGGPVAGKPLSISLCSDGIWDNWKFEEVAAFIHEPDRMLTAARSLSGQKCSEELMAANLARAQVNFGSSADNMTAVVLYFLPPAWVSGGPQ